MIDVYCIGIEMGGVYYATRFEQRQAWVRFWTACRPLFRLYRDDGIGSVDGRSRILLGIVQRTFPDGTRYLCQQAA